MPQRAVVERENLWNPYKKVCRHTKTEYLPNTSDQLIQSKSNNNNSSRTCVGDKTSHHIRNAQIIYHLGCFLDQNRIQTKLVLRYSAEEIKEPHFDCGILLGGTANKGHVSCKFFILAKCQSVKLLKQEIF